MLHRQRPRLTTNTLMECLTMVDILTLVDLLLARSLPAMYDCGISILYNYKLFVDGTTRWFHVSLLLLFMLDTWLTVLLSIDRFIVVKFAYICVYSMKYLNNDITRHVFLRATTYLNFFQIKKMYSNKIK